MAAIVPVVGTPATINLYSDTQPAVVVKVNAKSIIVQTVPVIEGSRKRINHVDEPFPAYVEDGDVTQPLGERQRFALTPNGRYGAGSITVTLGRSVKITDYRY